jgi:hypothetical protein
MNNKRGNNLKEESIGKRLLERFKEAIIKDDEAQLIKIAEELDPMIPNDKVEDIRMLFAGFVSLDLLYKQGLIKELKCESIEDAILERLIDNPKLEVEKIRRIRV